MPTPGGGIDPSGHGPPPPGPVQPPPAHPRPPPLRLIQNPPYLNDNHICSYLGWSVNTLRAFLRRCELPGPEFNNSASARAVMTYLANPRLDSALRVLRRGQPGTRLRMEDFDAAFDQVDALRRRRPFERLAEGARFIYAGNDLGLHLRMLAAAGRMVAHPEGSFLYSRAYKHALGQHDHVFSVYADSKPHSSSSGRSIDVLRVTATCAGLPPTMSAQPESWPEVGYVETDEIIDKRSGGLKEWRQSIRIG